MVETRRNPASRTPAACLRPGEICGQLLAALGASEGRRRRRRRNTSPDAIGMVIKRRLLEDAVRADPDPHAFEGWLLERCHSAAKFESEDGDPGLPAATGAARAMALDILSEWRLAEALPAFRSWLGAGAPSDDTEKPSGRDPSKEGPTR